jgi:hypothetical protein
MILRGQFRESIEMARAQARAKAASNSNNNNSAENALYVLNLPEDDAEVMTYFCQFAHFKSHELCTKPQTEFIEKMAFLCDKYMCFLVMQACGGPLLESWLGNGNERRISDASIEDLCRLFVFTYVVDLPK